MTDHLSELGIKLFRSDRRTISIEIRPSGIIVRAPRRMSPEEISAFLTKKKACHTAYADIPCLQPSVRHSAFPFFAAVPL